MARSLNEYEICNLLGDGNMSELEFSDEEINEQFEHEEIHKLLDDFKPDDNQDEVNEQENQPSSNINFNVSEKNNIKWVTVLFSPPEVKLIDLKERNYTNLYAIQTAQTRRKPTNCNEIK